MEPPKTFKKIQALPLKTRKIIFWVLIIICGLVMFFFWMRYSRRVLSDFQGEKFLEEIKLPELQEQLKKIPEINNGASLQESES